MRISKIISASFCFTLLLMNTQCDEDDYIPQPCDQNVVVDNGFYNTVESDPYEVSTIIIDGNCLTVEISASGCDGNSWSLVLVDSGEVAESSPEQRYLKLVLTNEELCLAVVSQTRSFNLLPIQVEGSNEIILNIEGVSDAITYAY